MKRLLCLMLALLMVLLCTACSDEKQFDENDGVVVDPTKLGDYKVEINGCRVYEDSVVVLFSFTNVEGDEPISFYDAFFYDASQDNADLDEVKELPETADYSTENQHKEVAVGETLSVEVAYKLRDPAKDVTVSIRENGPVLSIKEYKKTMALPI